MMAFAASRKPLAVGLGTRSIFHGLLNPKLPPSCIPEYSLDREFLPFHDPKLSRCGNGAVCVSFENNSPIVKLGIYYKSGPRFETGRDIGISHVIRNAAYLSSQHTTAFRVQRNIQQLGGNYSSGTSREHNIFTIEINRDKIDEGVRFLGDVASSPAFKQWEVDDIEEKLRVELAMLKNQPEVRLIEALHKAAYRQTLGNSLFMEYYKLGTFTTEQLVDYTERLHVGPNISLIGIGIEHEHFMDVCEKELTLSQLPSNIPPKPDPVRYYGGSARVETENPLVHAAVVTEGANLDHWDFLNLSVLQKILGAGPSIKYTDNLHSKLNKAAAKVAKGPSSVNCINANYTDSGLFGFHVVGYYNDMDNILTAVTKEFANIAKEGFISPEELKRGKALFKGDMHMQLEANEDLISAFGVQAAVAGELFNPPRQVNSACDKVTLEDINAVAKKLLSSKYTMAAVGKLSETPELEDLLEYI